MISVKPWIGGAAVAMALLLSATPAMAGPDRSDIFQQLGVDQVPADYVVLVDTSGSMAREDLYSEVRSTLSAFLRGLTSVDHVALYTFDDSPAPRYLGPAGDPGAIVATLPNGPNPNGRTDIGAAIASALDELERPDAAPVASVVLITDGEHEPPATSAYPAASGPAWTALADRVAKLRDHALAGYALSLRGQTGARLLGTVINPTTSLDPTSIGQLGEYLDRAKAGTRLAKARRTLAGDLGQGVSATWSIPSTVDLSQGSVALVLELRSRSAHTPLTVSGLSVAGPDGSTVEGQLPTTVDLSPGQTMTFPLTLNWPQSAGPVPYRRTTTVSGTVTLHGRVDSPWAAPLRPDIDLAIPPAIEGSVDAVVSATAVVGTWTVQVSAAAAVLGLAVLVFAVMLARRRQRQSGMLLAIDPATGSVRGRIPLRGRRTRIRGTDVPGRGTLTARRVERHFSNPDGLEYSITYRQNRRRYRGRFPAGGSVLTGPMAFEHESVHSTAQIGDPPTEPIAPAGPMPPPAPAPRTGSDLPPPPPPPRTGLDVLPPPAVGRAVVDELPSPIRISDPVEPTQAPSPLDGVGVPRWPIAPDAGP